MGARQISTEKKRMRGTSNVCVKGQIADLPKKIRLYVAYFGPSNSITDHKFRMYVDVLVE